MEHFFRMIGGVRYKGVIVDGEVYIHESALNLPIVRRDTDARLKIFTKVEYLLSTGTLLIDISPAQIPEVKHSTVCTHLRMLKRLSVGLDIYYNPKRVIKWVHDTQCPRLLSTILQ